MIKPRVLLSLTIMLIAFGLASCRPANTPISTEIAIHTSSVPTLESVAPTETVIPTEVATSEPRATPTESPAPAATTMPPTANAESKTSSILFQRGGNVWIMDATGQNPRQIASKAGPLSWSPSGKHLLLVDEKKLLVADALGSGSRLLYQDESIYQIGPETQWLNDRIVLLEIWADQFNPHIYYLDAETGKIRKTDPDYWRILEAVSVQGQFWIQSSDAGFEIADLSGTRVPILQNYNFGHTTQPAHSPNIVLLPSGEGAFFATCVGGMCNIYLAIFPNRQPGSISAIFEWGKEGERNLSNLSVSPDGKYLAFVSGEKELYFLNIALQTVEYKWPWSEDYYPKFYLWSPNSEAIIYKSWNQASGRFGICKLEVTTGKSQFLIEDNSVSYIADWKYITTP